MVRVMKRVLLTMDRKPGGHGPQTVAALGHAVDACGIDVQVDWVETADLRGSAAAADGVLVGPGSPYADMEAVLARIRRARTEGVPLLAT